MSRGATAQILQACFQIDHRELAVFPNQCSQQLTHGGMGAPHSTCAGMFHAPQDQQLHSIGPSGSEPLYHLSGWDLQSHPCLATFFRSLFQNITGKGLKPRQFSAWQP